MSISALQATLAEAERSAEARDLRFRRKVDAQNFLHHYVPILTAHLERGLDLGTALSSDAVAEDVEVARSVAMELAARLAGKRKADVNPYEARHLRGDVVRLVASRRRRGLDTEASDLVDALEAVSTLAERAADAQGAEWKGVTPTGSMALTAMRASLALFEATEAYDFRLGRERVATALVDAAVAVAREGAGTILGEDSSAEDRQSLFQSALRDVAGLLRARYVATARDTVDLLAPLERAERQAWLASNDPLGDMLAGFRSDARAFMAMAARMVGGAAFEPAAPQAPAP